MYRRSRTLARLRRAAPPFSLSVGGRELLVPGSRRPRNLAVVLAVLVAAAGELWSGRSGGAPA